MLGANGIAPEEISRLRETVSACVDSLVNNSKDGNIKQAKVILAMILALLYAEA